MAKCKHKESCGYEVCLDDCCPEFEAAVETNADRIRAMSDEELEKFINHFYVCDFRTNGECKMSYCGCCEICVMDWLQQPAEGKKDGRAVLHGLPGQG